MKKGKLLASMALAAAVAGFSLPALAQGNPAAPQAPTAQDQAAYNEALSAHWQKMDALRDQMRAEQDAFRGQMLQKGYTPQNGYCGPCGGHHGGKHRRGCDW